MHDDKLLQFVSQILLEILKFVFAIVVVLFAYFLGKKSR